MTRDTTRPRSETTDSAKSTSSPSETFKAQDDAALPKPSSRTKKGSLDFSKLDLRVEKVDERISPSETNVFDK